MHHIAETATENTAGLGKRVVIEVDGQTITKNVTKLPTPPYVEPIEEPTNDSYYDSRDYFNGFC